MTTGILQSASVTLFLLVAFTRLEGNANDSGESQRSTNAIVENEMAATKGHHLTSDDRIGDLLSHPAFGNFGRLILPWDNRDYDANMPLRDMGSLLPYHSHVNPDLMVSALNQLIDEVSNGKTIFYDFYTEAEKQAEPGRTNTGLFLLRGRPGAPFAIVAPGGGFAYVGSVHEGFPYAVEIRDKGFNAFVLKYRTGCGGACANQDMAAAITFSFRNAEMLAVGTGDYSLWGSSAGARMAASIGSHGVGYFGGRELPKPTTVVMAYTAHSDYSSAEPATFVVVGEEDTIAPASVMQSRVDALRLNGTEVEFHKYPNLGHGFGPGTGTSAEGWITDAIRFWTQRISKPDSRPLVSGSIIEASGQNFLVVTVNRSTSTPNSAYTLEVSSDLLTWVSRPAESVTITETPTQLVLRDNTPIQDVTARFIRLRVSAQ